MDKAEPGDMLTSASPEVKRRFALPTTLTNPGWHVSCSALRLAGTRLMRAGESARLIASLRGRVHP